MSQCPSTRGSLNLSEVPHSSSSYVVSSSVEAIKVGVLVYRIERVDVDAAAWPLSLNCGT